MRAQKLLYVFARRYQKISACMTVSVRELRTAVREWACWSPIDSCNANLKENPELAHNKDCFLKKLQFSLYMNVIYVPSYFWMLLRGKKAICS